MARKHWTELREDDKIILPGHEVNENFRDGVEKERAYFLGWETDDELPAEGECAVAQVKNDDPADDGLREFVPSSLCDCCEFDGYYETWE